MSRDERRAAMPIGEAIHLRGPRQAVEPQQDQSLLLMLRTFENPSLGEPN